MGSAVQDMPGATAPPPGPLLTIHPGRSFRPADYLTALCAAGLSFCLYLRTLAPSITGEDSGEFATAAFLPGIPHPPGYPLYCLLGHVFTRLPFGEPAWRVNLMSAMFAAGAVCLLVLTLIFLTRSRTAALLGSLAFACSREFWAQAVIAEVYTMNLFFAAACFLLLLVWSERRSNVTLYLFAFLFGLGLSLHNTFLLILPPCVLFVIACDWRARDTAAPFWGARARTWLLCCLLAVTALGVYAYLPIRSRANPMLDWGNPETLSNLYRHIRRIQYDFMFSQYPRDLERFLGQLAAYGRFWWQQFGPAPGILGALGLVVLLRRRLLFGLLLLSSALLIIAGFCFWQNFEQTREWLWVMRVFGIPAYYVTAVGLGCLLAVLGDRGKIARIFAVFLGLLCVALPLVRNFSQNDKSEYYWTRDYGANILVSLEKDAIFVSDSDHASFSILYLQAVYGMRPDVENLRKYGYLESGLFENLPEALRAKTGPFPPRRYDPELIAWLVDTTDRPVYLSSPMTLPTEKPVRLVPAGLTFRVLRPDESPSTYDYWSLYCWHTPIMENTRGDYTADTILYELEMTRAHEILIQAGQEEGNRERLHSDALVRMEAALQAYGRDPVMLNNVGVLCARYGLHTHAVSYFKEALEIMPHLAEAQRNLNKARERLEAGKKKLPVSSLPERRPKPNPEPLILLSQA